MDSSASALLEAKLQELKAPFKPKQHEGFTAVKKAALKYVEENYADHARKEFFSDELNLLRFYIDHDFKVDDTLAKWKASIEWRIESKIDEQSDADHEEECKRLVFYQAGFDRQNRPVVFFKARRHIPNPETIDRMAAHLVYMMEYAVRVADNNGSGEVTFVYDREEIKSENRDIDVIKKFFKVLRENYPGRLHDAYVMHPNWMYWLGWPFIKQVMSKQIAEVVKILKQPEEIHEFVDPAELAEEHTGTRNYIHAYKPGMYKLP